MQHGAKFCNKLKLYCSFVFPGLMNDVLPDTNAEKWGNIGNTPLLYFVEKSQQLL